MINTDKIARYVWNGRKDQFWYEECTKIFIELFGKERLELVAGLFAATSMNTSLKSNIRLFRRALWEIEHGKPVGEYLPNIKHGIYLVRQGKDLPGRKTNAFRKAMIGDPYAVVVDIWLMRAFGHTVTSPSEKQYSEIETWIRQEARQMKLEPRQLSAMIWAGVRIEVSGDRQTHYKELLRHQLTNLYNCI